MKAIALTPGTAKLNLVDAPHHRPYTDFQSAFAQHEQDEIRVVVEWTR